MKTLFLIKSLICMAFVLNSCSKDMDNPLQIKYALHNNDLPMNLYEFQIDGLPKECSVNIETVNMIGQKTATFSAKLDKDGFVVDDIIGINKFSIYFDSGYGECMGVTISQSWAPFNKKIGLLAFIPHPLEVSDEHGHLLGMIIRNIEGTEFNFFLSGFEPEEDVDVKLTSGHHIAQKHISMDEKGKYQFRYKPIVNGDSEGPFIVTVSNKTTNLSLQHYWGIITFTPPSGYLSLKDKFPDFFSEHENHAKDDIKMLNTDNVIGVSLNKRS